MPWTAGTHTGTSGTIAGTTGLTLGLGATTTVGQVVVASDGIVGSGQTPTITDSASNVLSWTTVTQNGSTNGVTSSIAWGVATITTAPNITFKWSGATSAAQWLFIGSFTTPGGTISADGSATYVDSSPAATIVTPAGGGTGASDLVINNVTASGAWTSTGSPWVSFTASAQLGNMTAYAINVAGNQTPNMTCNSAGNSSLVIALQPPAGAVVIPDLIAAPFHR